MPIAERTIKSLFAKSQNKCANPDCLATLVVEDTVLGEICHIRARRKGGSRYDPSLTEEQKNSARNLILLCPTCHALIDKDKTGAFSVEWLDGIKADHERRHRAVEISTKEAQQALAILAHSKAKKKGSKIRSQVKSHADRGGIAVSFGRDNYGNINIRTASNIGPRGYPPNSIGADANLSGYIDYLCDLYVKYMSPIETNVHSLQGKIGRFIKTKFRLVKRTRNDLPTERFEALVTFLYEKLAKTPVGRKHLRQNTKLCSTFNEWRTTTR